MYELVSFMESRENPEASLAAGCQRQPGKTH